MTVIAGWPKELAQNLLTVQLPLVECLCLHLEQLVSYMTASQHKPLCVLRRQCDKSKYANWLFLFANVLQACTRHLCATTMVIARQPNGRVRLT